MLRYIYGRDLPAHPLLQATMHRDRADQFKRRLGCEPHPRHFYLKVPGLITGTLARWLQPKMFPPRYETDG